MGLVGAAQKTRIVPSKIRTNTDLLQAKVILATKSAGKTKAARRIIRMCKAIAANSMAILPTLVPTQTKKAAIPTKSLSAILMREKAKPQVWLGISEARANRHRTEYGAQVRRV